MLRSAEGRPAAGLALAALAGALAGALVLLGNPANMGLCGACFLRDLAGTLGLHAKGPAVFRPEIVGVLLGATAWCVARGRWQARTGSHAATRVLHGMLMGVGALVFLGCPFRMLQRLGGGDLTALPGLAGFLAGVGVATWLEARGHHAGKTAPAPAPAGWLGPAAALAILALFLADALPAGPRRDASGEGPARAPWGAALGVALVAGAALSASGFCAVSAGRQVFRGGGRMLAGAGVLVAAYAAVAALGGKWSGGWEGQPFAHGEWAWSFAAMVLVGLAGAFGGGCPVRQVVMAGEGNGDAALSVAGIAGGAALAHNLGWAASPKGVPEAGRWAVAAGIVIALGWALATARGNRAAAA